MRTAFSITILLAVSSVAGALAGETNTVGQPQGWLRSATIGATLTRGNSKTILSSGSFLAEQKSDGLESRLGAEINFGQAEMTETNGTAFTDTNVNNSKAFGEIRRSITPKTYLYYKVDALTDRTAGIDYRFVIGPGVGFYLLKNEAQSLGFDLGVSYIRQEPATEENVAALRVGQRYDLKIGPAAKLWESVEYLPAINDFHLFFMNAEFGVETAINARLTLRILVQDKYNSDAPADKEKNDLIMISGIGVKF